jgi:alpha-L-rhamnosidase
MVDSMRLLPLACLLSLTALATSCGVVPEAAPSNALARSLSVIAAGAAGDGVTVNTTAVQSAIDRVAAEGGGTVVIPPGVFVSGALFFKPGVHLRLEKDAVLRCSTDLSNFPPRRTRIEGHFEESFTPALINADGCDGLRISGEGTLDGDGRPIWDKFWSLRRAAPDPGNFPNLGVARARLALIENSRDVVIEGVTFKDSQFWNLHLYRCRDVLVRNVRICVPDDYKQAPSTDGIDVDSCQDVTIRGYHFSVTDDCIAMKGAKGPLALGDKDSPPVERVRVVDCVFKRGHAAVTLGSEATIVRDVVVENCRVLGSMAVANFKLRSDTPQRYEDIHFRNITLAGTHGALLSMQPWKQYADLRGLPPPKSIVRDVTLSGIRGSYGSFGTVQGNPEQTSIRDITLTDISLQLRTPDLAARDVENLCMQNVTINAVPVAP